MAFLVLAYFLFRFRDKFLARFDLETQFGDTILRHSGYFFLTKGLFKKALDKLKTLTKKD